MNVYIQFNFLDGERFTESAEIKNIQWQTFTGVLGDEVVGIWEKYTNKTDVNATDANFSEQCLVTGDGLLLNDSIERKI